MSCPKCCGLLVTDRHLDFYGRSTGWKCINCGWSHTDKEQVRRAVNRATSRHSRKNKFR